MQQDRATICLYHGAQTRRGRLDPAASSCLVAFGPGLYLTGRPDTAHAHARSDGFIHEVRASISKRSCVDINLPLADQEADIRERLRAALWDLPHSSLNDLILTNVRNREAWGTPPGTDPKLYCYREVFRLLVDQGFTLLHGYLPAQSYSGASDRGRQFLWLGEPLEPRRIVSGAEWLSLRVLEADVVSALTEDSLMEDSPGMG